MRHLVLWLGLTSTLALAQNIYEWVDAKGEHHFTDDASKVPKGAKVKVTKQEEPPTPSTARPERPSSSSGSSGGADCEGAKKHVTDLEQQIVDAKASLETQRKAHDEQCQTLLRTHGQPAYARCMAEEVKGLDTAALEKALEQAKEMLRRAQVGGCR